MPTLSVTEAVQNVLTGNSALIALIPASRIKPGTAAQLQGADYIVHFPVAGSPVHTLDELAALRFWDAYQISVFADNYNDGDLAAIAVRNAVGRVTVAEGIEFMLSGEPRYMGFESGLMGSESDLATGTHHFMLELKIAEGL